MRSHKPAIYSGQGVLWPTMTIVVCSVRSFVALMWPRCGPSGLDLGRRVRALRSAWMLRR